MLTGTCRRKEPEMYGRGCLADVSQYVEMVVPEICFSSRRAIFDAINVGRSSSVSCDEGLCDVSHYKLLCVCSRHKMWGGATGGRGVIPG
jgi:hypothetical protein